MNFSSYETQLKPSTKCLLAQNFLNKFENGNDEKSCSICLTSHKLCFWPSTLGLLLLLLKAERIIIASFLLFTTKYGRWMMKGSGLRVARGTVSEARGVCILIYIISRMIGLYIIFIGCLYLWAAQTRDFDAYALQPRPLGSA